MEIFSLKFWVFFQMLIDAFLVVMVLYFLRNMKTGWHREATTAASERIIKMLEPLSKEAELTTRTFDNQLNEKKSLIRDLNQKLDSRIISLNLLLNRSEAWLQDPSLKIPLAAKANVCDQQESIIQMHSKGLNAATIARKLSMWQSFFLPENPFFYRAQRQRCLPGRHSRSLLDNPRPLLF